MAEKWLARKGAAHGQGLSGVAVPESVVVPDDWNKPVVMYRGFTFELDRGTVIAPCEEGNGFLVRNIPHDGLLFDTKAECLKACRELNAANEFAHEWLKDRPYVSESAS
jgi:hypothetical protein